VPSEPRPAADLPRPTRTDQPGRHLATLDEELPPTEYPAHLALDDFPGGANHPSAPIALVRPPFEAPFPSFEPAEPPASPAPLLTTQRAGSPLSGGITYPSRRELRRRSAEPADAPADVPAEVPAPQYADHAVADDDVPTTQLKARDIAAATAPRRRDMRVLRRASVIVRRDKRRRLVAGGTLIAVIGMIVVPSLIDNVAQADGVSSGTMALRPGFSGTADSGVVLAQGTASASFTVPKRPAGGSLYLAVETRATSKGAYRAKLRVFPDGQLNVGLSKIVGGSETLLGARTLGARLPVGGSTVNVQTAIGDNDPTTLRVRAWLDGMTRPGWQYSVKDSTPQLVNGSVRAWSYLSSAATAPLTVTFKNLGGVKAGTVPVVEKPQTQPSQPVLTPTNTPSAVATVVKPTIKPSEKPLPGTGGSPGTGGGTGDGSTGVPDGTDLKVHSGNLVVTKDGATFTGLDIRGFVDIRAADVTIRNSLIRGGEAGNGSRGIVNVTDTSARRFVLESSEIRPAHPSVRLDGINGSNFTLRKVEIDGGVDAAKIFGNNVKIESSWLHGTQRFANDPYQGGKETHNDAIQVQGGTDISIRNSRIEGGNTAGIMVTQGYAATKSLTISGNRLSGGSCTINIVPSDLPTVGPITLTNNVFVRDSTIDNCSVARTASTQMTASGNTFTDGSAAKINVWN
jgi:hypothetical protein